MNERIRELAEQAQQYAEYVTPQGLEWFDTFKEKFAELIIKECAYIDFYKRVGISLKDNYRVTKVITDHFGIKQ